MISLQEYSTFRLPAYTDTLTTITTSTQLQSLITNKNWDPNKILILGEGSNTLFTENFSGHILINRIKGIEIIDEDTTHISIRVGSGEYLNDLVERSIKQDYAGLENLILIPGTIGAAPVQNVGAYGVEIQDLIVQVEGINTQTGQVHTYTKSECQFGYRNSIFKTTLQQQIFITAIVLRLKKWNKNYKPIIHYGDIQEKLQEQGRDKKTVLHPDQVARAIATIRASKLPNWKEIGTAGSFFQNPIIATEQYNTLLTTIPQLIGHVIDSNKTKLSAGQLIELCGLKGKAIGDAAISNEHALVLINRGNATGKELQELISLIQKSVYMQYGILLHPEVNIY